MIIESALKFQRVRKRMGQMLPFLNINNLQTIMQHILSYKFNLLPLKSYKN